MTLPNQITDYFEAERAGNPLNGLISELLTVGDALHDARRTHHDSCDLIDDINSSDIGFTLKYKEGAAEKSPIRPSKIRESLGIPEEDIEDVVLSRDAIKIKFSCKDKRKLLIDFDAAANFKDRNHNWGLHGRIKNDRGEIAGAAIYIPQIGEIYVADENGAHLISFPPFRGADQTIKIKPIAIGPLAPKYNAEVGSWHTKERAFVKTLFTVPMREQIGGSLRESGMKEAPFVWVGLDRLGYTMIGNLKPKDGLVGSFIAEKAGAALIRLPITSDSQGRDVVFAIHPDIVEAVIEKFADAIRLSQGDVTIGTPKLVRNADPALIRR